MIFWSMCAQSVMLLNGYILGWFDPFVFFTVQSLTLLFEILLNDKAEIAVLS